MHKKLKHGNIPVTKQHSNYKITVSDM